MGEREEMEGAKHEDLVAGMFLSLEARETDELFDMLKLNVGFSADLTSSIGDNIIRWEKRTDPYRPETIAGVVSLMSANMEFQSTVIQAQFEIIRRLLKHPALSIPEV